MMASNHVEMKREDTPAQPVSSNVEAGKPPICLKTSLKGASSVLPPPPPSTKVEVAEQVAKVWSRVRLLSPRRKERIEEFLTQVHLRPMGFGEPWSNVWISHLIAALAEPQKDAVTPSDVRAWRVNHRDFFETTQKRILKLHEESLSQAAVEKTLENFAKLQIASPCQAASATAPKIPVALHDHDYVASPFQSADVKTIQPKSPAVAADRFANHRKVAGHPIVSPREYLEVVTSAHPEPMVSLECNNTFQIVGEFDQESFMKLAAYLVRKGVVKEESLPFKPPPFPAEEDEADGDGVQTIRSGKRKTGPGHQG